MHLGEQYVRWFMAVDLFGIQFNQITAIVLLSVYGCLKYFCILMFLLSLYVSLVSFSVLYCFFLCPTWRINVFNRQQLQKLNACWNNVSRKVFQMQLWESVKELQFLCERLDFIHIYSLKKLMFLYKLTRINNKCLKVCLRVYRRSSGFITMCSEFDTDSCHCGVIKSHVFSHLYAVVVSRRQ